MNSIYLIFLKQPMTAALFIICFSILTYQSVSFVQQLMSRYRDTYIESVDVGLKDLFIVFKPEDLFKISLMLAISSCIITYLMFANIIFSIFSMTIGFGIPKLYLNWAKKRRLESLNLQLIDGLTLVSNALRAGQSLPQAFSLLVEEMPAPISQEFGILTKEYDLGVPIEKCLRNLSIRVKSNEIELFVNSILICAQTGGNLTETFDNIAIVIRERIRLEGKIQSMTAEGRTQGLVLTLLPFLLGLAFYWIDPQLIMLLFTTLLGKILLILILLLDVAAWFITKKIVDIDI